MNFHHHVSPTYLMRRLDIKEDSNRSTVINYLKAYETLIKLNTTSYLDTSSNCNYKLLVYQ